MIGVWTRFGEGEPPQDGEVIVFITLGEPSIDMLYARPHEARLAIYRGGMVTDQDRGTSYLTPGTWWTSLPPPSARAG